MSCFSGKKLTEAEIKERERSKVIETEIKKDNQEQKKHQKILLLGTGDAGKSTFAKQMSLLHNKGSLSDQYIDTFIPALKDNALQGMQVIINYMKEAGHTFPAEMDKYTQVILEATDLKPDIAKAITDLWKNVDFQNTTKENAEDAQLQGGVSGAQYYFTHAERFASPGFRPTTEDMLNCRRKTTGIVETEFTAGNTIFTMVDVGGQRSERKKWLHCFGSVSCVIFLTAVNEYDMVLEEDSKTNRLVESLKLWKALTSSQFFKKTPFVLFLNKSDLFAEKLKRTPLIGIFADFEQFEKDPANSQMSDYEKAWKYISKQYQLHFAGGVFYPYLTCALDSEQCQKVFNVIQDTLFKEAIEAAQFK